MFLAQELPRGLLYHHRCMWSFYEKKKDTTFALETTQDFACSPSSQDVRFFFKLL